MNDLDKHQAELDGIDAVTAEVDDRVSFGHKRGVVTVATNHTLTVKWWFSLTETTITRADAEAVGYTFEEGNQ